MKKLFVTIILAFLLVSAISAQQSTSFSYQGKLNSSSAPANGNYDFKFELYNVLTNGTPIGTVNSSGVQVVSGIFSVQLDFGANAFDGTDRFLDISVKLPSETTYTTLTPRQKISSVPYAIKAIAADTATVAQTANNATNLGGISANNYLLNTGDGSQLINVNGSFKWNVITGNQQAVSNNGYYVNSPMLSNTEVAINLPTNPQIGDVIKVSGNLGWRLTQNNGQNVTRDGFPSLSTPWSIRATFGSSLNIKSIACTPDGSKLVGSFSDSSIRTSNDYGYTWTSRISSIGGDILGISADGTTMVSVIIGSRFYVSNDSGVTWTQRETNRDWSWVALSADGRKMVADAANGQIYTSTDSGLTWTPRENNRNWWGVTSSADGSKLAATVKGGRIYTSTDSGVTWTPRETNRNWTEIKSTPDGTKLYAFLEAASTAASGVYFSTDSGLTWIFKSFGLTAGSFSNLGYPQVAVSDNGKVIGVMSNATMTIGSNTANTIFSIDSGQTWFLGPTSQTFFRPLAGSSDMKYIYGAIAFNLIAYLIDSAKPGSLGYLTGSAGSSVELLYIGNGEFTIINSRGTIRFF